MVATHYKNYFLQILLAWDNQCDAPFSLIIKIMANPDRKPMTTLCIAEPIRSQQEGISRGFEVGRHWVDTNLLPLESPVLAAEKTITRSRRIALELQHLILKTAQTISQSENLVYRSHSASSLPNFRADLVK